MDNHFGCAVQCKISLKSYIYELNEIRVFQKQFSCMAQEIEINLKIKEFVTRILQSKLEILETFSAQLIDDSFIKNANMQFCLLIENNKQQQAQAYLDMLTLEIIIIKMIRLFT